MSKHQLMQVADAARKYLDLEIQDDSTVAGPHSALWELRVALSRVDPPRLCTTCQVSRGTDTAANCAICLGVPCIPGCPCTANSVTRHASDAGERVPEAIARAEKAEAERDAARRELEELVVRLCGQERDLGDARHERDAARREAAEARALCALLGAREAERDAARLIAAEAQAREAVLRKALAQIEDRAPDEPDDGEERGDLWKDVIEFGRLARRALADPADRAALDALLAQAHAEGRRVAAQACIEAARAAVGRDVRLGRLVGASGVVAAVERAAREAASLARAHAEEDSG